MESLFVDTEWMFQSKLLNLTLEYLFFKPDRLIDNINRLIDLFATNINIQFGKYATFRPDLGAMYTYAFNIDWSHLKFYAFCSYFSHI